MFKYLTLSLIALTTFSCSSDNDTVDNSAPAKNYEKLNKASWLLGDWEQQTEDGTATEHWERQNDSTFIGSSYFLIEKDTVSAETMVLEQRGDTLTYNPTVREQNDMQAIQFTLTSSSDSMLVFENPAHDFPQKITYKIITADSIFAEISGNIKGEQKKISFPYTRLTPSL